MQYNSLNYEMLCLGPCQLIALLHSSIRPVYCYLYITCIYLYRLSKEKIAWAMQVNILESPFQKVQMSSRFREIVEFYKKANKLE